MSTVGQILETKGRAVRTIDPNASVYEAVRIMAEHSIGALVVTDDRQVVGIISERDYARKIVLLGRTSLHTTVREIMTSPAVVCGPEWDLQRCMQVMTERRFRHLPVVDNGRLVGLVSIGDVVKSIIGEQRFVIDSLEGYLHIAPV